MAVRGCFKILCYAFCSAPVRFTLQLSKQYFYITDSSLFFLSAVIYLQLGSSLSPSIMTGGTYQRIGAIAPWRSVLLFFTPLSAGTEDCSCRCFCDTAARFREALLLEYCSLSRSRCGMAVSSIAILEEGNLRGIEGIFG